MSTTLIDRSALIERILAAARRPCPDIVPVNYLLCSDGVYRGAMGIPYGVEVVKPYQTQLQGYAYRDARSGCTFGTRGQTAEELRAQHKQRQDKNDADFRRELEAMNEERFESQVAYWLKGGAQ